MPPTPPRQFRQWVLRGLAEEYLVVPAFELPIEYRARVVRPVLLEQALLALRDRDHRDRELLEKLFAASHGRLRAIGSTPGWAQMVAEVRRSIRDARLVGLLRARPAPAAAPPPVDPSPESGPPEPEPAPKEEKNAVSLSLEAKHFAPEVETLGIHFQISGPLEKVTSLTLSVARAAEPGKALLRHKLPIDAASGKYPWRGVVAGFADGFLTVKGSPYEVKLSMDTAGGKVESNKEKLSVLPLEVRVEVLDSAPAKVDAAHQQALSALMKDVNAGKAGKLVLKSSLFKTTNEEMNDDASFREYKNKWKRGIPIPLVVSVPLKGKSGAAKRSPKALHGSKILWDVSLGDDATFDADLDSRSVHPTAKKFLTKVSAHKKDSSEPKGRTCHRHFGGERAATADRGADKYWEVLDGGWALADPAQRKWSAWTDCAVVGADTHDSGVQFWSGRMAGDTHWVRAYLDVDGSLDDPGDKKLEALAPIRKSKPVSWSVWRKVEVAKMYKIGASTPDLSLTNLNSAYGEAAMVIANQPGVKTEEIQAQWRAEYQKVLAAQADDDFLEHAALDDPGVRPVAFRKFEDYRKHMYPEDSVFAGLRKRVAGMFSEPTEDAYRAQCSANAYPLYIQIVAKFGMGANGLTLFNFGGFGEHNQPEKTGVVAGIAPDVPGKSGRNAALFLLFAGGVSGRILTHEVGHHLFLAHGPGHFNAGEQPGGYQENAHDAAEPCVMSYHGSDPEVLCGLCQLKLRGWNYAKVNKDGSVN